MDDAVRPKFKLSLLGRFELSGPDGPIDLTSKKLAALLAFLACTAPQAHSRDKLMTLLWGSRFDAQARQSLRQALTRLRRPLGEDALVTAGESVSLQPGAIACDVARFEAMLRNGSREAMIGAMALYKGGLVADMEIPEDAWTEWVEAQRQRLEGLALDAMMKFGEQELEAGNQEHALDAANRVIVLSNLREDAHRLIMRALAAGGRRADALKHYEDLKVLLKRELTVEPDPNTRSLAAELRKSHIGRSGSEGKSGSPSELDVSPETGADALIRASSSASQLPLRTSPLNRSTTQSIPSIAVLPFRNASGTAAENYFGEGVTEEIITSLARSQTISVIARHSTLQFRNHDRALGEIARALNVRYLLDGSIRRHSNRLRINAQLVEGEDGRTLWAEHYEGDETDVFEFQDRIAASIAPIIEPQIYRAEVAKALKKPTQSLAAYDCVLRALSSMYCFDDERFAEAGGYLDQAIALDPKYALAFGYKAWWNNLLVGEGRSKDASRDIAAAIDLARRASALDNNDAFILAVMAHVHAFLLKRTDLAVDLFERALSANRSSAFAWALSAATRAYRGEPDDALERLDNAFRLSPYDLLNFLFWAIAGLAHFVAGRYEMSLEWLHRSRQANPRFTPTYRMMVGCLAMLGRIGEARIVARDLLEIDPSFRVSKLAEWYPLLPDDLARLVRGMRAAGLPE